MRARTLIVISACIIFCTGLFAAAFGQELKPIQLPEPKLDQSKSLAQVLKDRKTTREFSEGNLPQQTLSYQCAFTYITLRYGKSVMERSFSGASSSSLKCMHNASWS